MSRDRFDDIPEAFRKAFEDSNWGRGSGNNGGDDDNGGNGPGNGNRPPYPPRGGDGRSPFQNRTFWIFGIIIVLFLSLSWIVDKYTEWLWFTQLSYQDVWFKQWGVQVVSFVGKLAFGTTAC